jgi:hypothetical protein
MPPSVNGDLPWPAAGTVPFSALIGASSEPMNGLGFFFFGRKNENINIVGVDRE